MKSIAKVASRAVSEVSTLVVEWIEIPCTHNIPWLVCVSTLVVEWIEISYRNMMESNVVSPPSWWSGLKSVIMAVVGGVLGVSTLVVEWIEITT